MRRRLLIATLWTMRYSQAYGDPVGRTDEGAVVDLGRDDCEVAFHDDLYLAQWDYFRTKRGSDQLHGPRGEVTPRTRNADVLQLATFWSKPFSE